jgi:hypothetical protein
VLVILNLKILSLNDLIDSDVNNLLTTEIILMNSPFLHNPCIFIHDPRGDVFHLDYENLSSSLISSPIQ